MTVYMDGVMETRSVDEDLQYRQFCRRRIDEIDDILSQKLDPVSHFGNKVRFICSSSVSVDFPTSNCEENCSSSPSKCFQNEVVYCDILILAASLHVSESPESSSWLLSELKNQMNLSQFASEEKDMVTIFLPEWSLDEAKNLKLLLESLTTWAPLKPNALENLLSSHFGKVLGLYGWIQNKDKPKGNYYEVFSLCNMIIKMLSPGVLKRN